MSTIRKIHVPKYRKHKPSKQAVVTIDGVHKYLGKYGTKASHEEYARLLAEHLAANGQPVPVVTAVRAQRRSVHVTVVEAASKYVAFTAEHKGVGESARVRAMVAILVGQFENERAAAIGPAELRELRTEMIARDWSRSYVNDLVDCVKRMYKWLAVEDLVPVTVYHKLQLIAGLRRGESGVRETAPVLPIDDAIVDATLPYLPDVVADMVRLQRLTGMRPVEVCIFRPCDVDRAGDVWLYHPETHKTEHLGKERVVFVGPKAQALLLPYLDRDREAHCFQPRESESRRRVVRGRGKKRPLSALADRYDACTYRRAIHRACDKAFPHATLGAVIRKKQKLTVEQRGELREWQSEHRWSPNRLRHTKLTEVRRELGLEAAQIVGGHSRADVTQIYAERDMAKGAEAARLFG